MRASVPSAGGVGQAYPLRAPAFSRRQARAVARQVPRLSVRDGYREPDQTREPRGPSPSGGNFTASSLSLSYPAPLGRGVGCRASPCQTGEPRGLLPSGGKTPAKPRVPRAAPRPKGAMWGAGHRPARPASREACRRAAVASRPAYFPTSCPAPYGRGVGLRGSAP